MTGHVLDVRGHLCPIPVIRTQNTVKKLMVGDKLTVICSDPGVLHDIPAWCRVHGHTLLGTETQGREYTVVIQIEAV